MPSQKDLSRDFISSNNPSEDLAKGRSYFFGIAIDNYADKAFGVLNNAVKDVKEIQSILLEKYVINSALVLSNEDATRSNILNRLQRFRKLCNEYDKLLIYFAGHGYQDDDHVGYWIPSDAQGENYLSTYICHSEVIRILDNNQARHILLMSDACFSGNFILSSKYRSGNFINDNRLKDLENDPSRWVIAPAKPGKKVKDGPPGKNSPFAEAFISALKTNYSEWINIQKFYQNCLEEEYKNRFGSGEDNYPICRTLNTGKFGGSLGEYIFYLNEKTFWEQMQKLNTIESYNLYLKKFPKGSYRNEANERIRDLENKHIKRPNYKGSFRGPKSSQKAYVKKVTDELRTILHSGEVDDLSTEFRQVILELYERIHKNS